MILVFLMRLHAVIVFGIIRIRKHYCFRFRSSSRQISVWIRSYPFFFCAFATTIGIHGEFVSTKMVFHIWMNRLMKKSTKMEIMLVCLNLLSLWKLHLEKFFFRSNSGLCGKVNDILPESWICKEGKRFCTKILSIGLLYGLQSWSSHNCRF